MNDHDKRRFASLVKDCMAFYGKEPSVFTLGVWWEACKPFDFEQVNKAFTRHATDPDRGQFSPMPADIIRQLGGTSTDAALLAWQKAYRAIGEVGGYRSVIFDDMTIHSVISDIGGWTTFCRTEVDELPHLQRRFCELYRTLVRREGLEPPPVLMGENEASNRLRGLATAPPALVGGRKIENRKQTIISLPRS